MNNYFKAFWILFLVDAITPLFTLASYFDLPIREYSKIPLILFFLLFTVFHIQNRLKYNGITILFTVAFIISFFIGLIINLDTFDSKVFSQLYGIIMPVLSISFGMHYAYKYTSTLLKPYIEKIIKYYIMITLIIYVLYFINHYMTGAISYFGFQTNWQFISAYFISTNRIIWFYFGMVVVLVAGKRATLITAFLPFFSYLKNHSSSLSINNVVKITSIIITVGVGFYFASQGDLLRRMQSTIEFDISDPRATYIATSGRWQEIESVYIHMNNKPFSWFIGSGLGDKFLINTKIESLGIDNYMYQHYAHFSPVSYVFKFGIVFTIILYYMFIRLIVRGWTLFSNDFYYLCFLVSIVGAMFGANLDVDPKIWFFVGVVIAMEKINKNK